MSTHACFEKHKSVAREHEEKAKHFLDDPTLSSKAGSSAGKILRMATAQQKLAVREYQEAVRLRPRDLATRSDLQAASKTLRSLQSAMEQPKPCGLRRFLAHYNLSIRYWDLGKASQAIIEAGRACDELIKVGLPTGCAEQNRTLMERLQSKCRPEYQRLTAAVRDSPKSVGANYALGILYFDKRMMLQAESQLRWTRDRAKEHSLLCVVEHDRQQLQSQAAVESSPVAALIASTSPAVLKGQKARERIHGLLSDLEDDLEYIGGLRQKWCVETEAGKSDELQELGIRDGARPHILPCLHSRFEQDPQACEACDRWWMEICTRGDFSEPVPQRRASGSQPPRRSGYP